MRKNMNSLVAVFALILATLIPAQSFGAPISSPGKTAGNGPCVTSGSDNSQIQSTKNTMKTCYSVGETGPGGGIVIFYSQTAFAEPGAGCRSSCHYLEAAPTTGPAAWEFPAAPWSGITDTSSGATGSAIGTGYRNTTLMISQSGAGSAGAASLAKAYRGPNNKSDWFLPSKEELNLLYLNAAIVGGIGADYLWSSTESDGSTAWVQGFGDGVGGNFQKFTLWKSPPPVRAF